MNNEEETPQARAIKMVCKQTNYTENVAKDKLEMANWNVESVIKSYLNIAPQDTQFKPKNVNQEIFKQFRQYYGSNDKLRSGATSK